jgi:predicted RNA-binding Zn ribbon-like protein
VSGNLALDFAGTVAHRNNAREDSLSSPPRLAEWAAAAGLVDSPPAVTEAEFARAVAVREAICRLARVRLAGEPRRWCEMSGCGNRAKVAGYRARRSAGHPAERAARTRP